MATTNGVPEGMGGVLPHLTVDGAVAAIEFYERAFGAEELYRMPADDGRLLHAQVRINGSVVMLHDEFPEWGGKPTNPKALGGSSVKLHVYVADCDAAVERAAGAGAEVLMPPTDAFWGDRYAMLRDPFGHEWSIATKTKVMSSEEIAAAQAEWMASQAGGAGGGGPSEDA